MIGTKDSSKKVYFEFFWLANAFSTYMNTVNLNKIYGEMKAQWGLKKY